MHFLGVALNRDLQRRVAVSAGLILLYWLLGNWAFPGTTEEVSRAPQIAAKMGFFKVGLSPFISGFMLVGLVAKLMGRAYDVNARQWMFRLSLGLGIVIAVVSVWIHVRWLTFTDFEGQELLASGFATKLGAGAFFLVGSALTFVVGLCISRFGFGNGFVLMLFFDVTRAAFFSCRDLFENFSAHYQTTLLPLALFFALTAGLYRILRRRPSLKFRFEQREYSWQPPLLPQGLAGENLSRIIGLVSYFSLLAPFEDPVILLIGSVAAFAFILGPWQMRKAIADTFTFEEGWKFSYWRFAGLRILLASVVIAIVVAPVTSYWPGIEVLLPLFQLYAAYLVIQDLCGEWRLRSSAPEVLTLGDYDNHFKLSVAETVLREKGVAFHFQGLGVRNSVDWLGAIYKVQPLVAAGDEPHVRQFL